MPSEPEPSQEDRPKNHTDEKTPDQPKKSEPQVTLAPTEPQSQQTPQRCEITCNKERDWVDKGTLVLQGIGLFVLVVYTIFTGLMYCSNKKAANAAKSAADTAKDALHITQRAYVTDGPASMDSAKHSIIVPILNNGHIPSGSVEVIIHEATITTDVPTKIIDLKYAGERHWGRYNFPSIPIGWPLSIAIPVSQMSVPHLNSGRQTIIIAGVITYNDGFPNTPEQQWSICQKTTYQIIMKQMLIGPCKPGDNILHIMESLDGYPNNPEQ
jgi:hypothetical protein